MDAADGLYTGSMAAVIRKAVAGDLPAVGRLGAELLLAHYRFDPQRFMQGGADAEDGYAWFLGTQLDRPDSLVLVAESDGDVVGYLYAGIEPRNWKELREEAGFVHDILVHEDSRGAGIAQHLMDGAVEWFRQRGMPRAILWTAARNTQAHRLFERLGFRSTMIEMTRELE
jgi:ribosomal protein S18 acetylase RimI-like enzyme